MKATPGGWSCNCQNNQSGESSKARPVILSAESLITLVLTLQAQDRLVASCRRENELPNTPKI
jgi:hypothetical protein